MPNLKILAANIPKIRKVGHVTPSRPVNRGSPVTPYLDSSFPICLFTIQLSWGYDDY